MELAGAELKVAQERAQRVVRASTCAAAQLHTSRRSHPLGRKQPAAPLPYAVSRASFKQARTKTDERDESGGEVARNSQGKL